MCCALSGLPADQARSRGLTGALRALEGGLSSSRGGVLNGRERLELFYFFCFSEMWCDCEPCRQVVNSLKQNLGLYLPS